jgi:hypothetical protein
MRVCDEMKLSVVNASMCVVNASPKYSKCEYVFDECSKCEYVCSKCVT